MSWNYRVVRQSRPGGGESFTVHEAYYDSDIGDQQEMDASKRPDSICPDLHEPIGLTVKELEKELMLMTRAFERPVVEGSAYHVKVRYERKKNKSVAEDLHREVRAAQKEARDWKKAYLKANTERIALQKELEDIKRLTGWSK